MGGPPGNFFQAEHRDHFPDFFPGFLLGGVELERSESDFIQNGRAKELNIRILKKESHPPTEKVRKGGVLEHLFGEAAAESPNFPCRGKEKTVQNLEERGFPAPVGPQDDQPLSGLDFQVDSLQGRVFGGKGVINIRFSDRNGEVVTVKEVVDDDELLLITEHGIVNRLAISSIRSIGRATQGVRLISLEKSDKVVDVARVPAAEKMAENGNGAE